MKKFFILLLVTVGVFALPSCGSDEPDPDNGSKIDPTKPVADPDGTITLSMRDYNNGCTYILDRLYIKNENFRGADIASVGSVTGLGNVSTIPTTGWTDEVAVVPGNGYVAYLANRDMFVRIYVIDYITSTGGGIMGADVKYQYPFKGSDEALQLEKTAVSLNAEGGNDNIAIKNSNFIPFNISADQSWIQVKKTSTYMTHVLYNGIMVGAADNTTTESREGTVTMTTLYGKQAKIKVTQAGVAPYIDLSESEVESNNAAKTITAASLSTNIEIDNLEVTSSGSWCTAEIATQYYAPKTIRFIDGKRVNKTIKSSPTHYLNLAMTENDSYDDRTATVTVKDKTSSTKATLKLTQKGKLPPYVKVTNATMNFSASESSQYNIIETNVDASRIEVTSSANWAACEMEEVNATTGKANLKCHVDGYMEENDRTATINIKVKDYPSAKASFTIVQVGPLMNFSTATYSTTVLGGEYYNSISTDGDVTMIEVASDKDWVTVEFLGSSSNYVKFNVASNNTGEDRTAIVSAKFKGFQKPTATFNIKQSGFKCDMVLVEGGTFQMGGSQFHSGPIHTVTLSSYSIGKYEVTHAQWKAVMGDNPSYFEGDNLPVVNVSWNYCQTFITKLNQLTGKKFRLPTEAEWEYAARGGNKSKGYEYAGGNNIDVVGWYSGNSSSKTHPVGQMLPNELGIYDMSGNAYEWCYDYWGEYPSYSQTNPVGPSSGSGHVVRGGSISYEASECEVSSRSTSNSNYPKFNVGFRLALSQ